MVSIWSILDQVKIRSKATISNEMKCYFEKLIESLVTNHIKRRSFEKNLMKKSTSKMLQLKSSNPSYQFIKTQLISTGKVWW